MKAKRKGVVRRADVSPALLSKLNKGEEEALTLAEVLSVDFAKLMKSAFPDIDKKLIAEIDAARETGWVGRTKLAGELLYKGFGRHGWKKTVNHASDQVRGWGAGLIAAAGDLDLEERLKLIIPFADDPNPGTRETAWIVMRPHIAADLPRSIRMLKDWTKHDSANIRRFASEITRPRGVWCAHITTLRQNPKPGLAILEPLIEDPSRYVQNSVANWMNDASKDNPAFVRDTCRKWQKQSRSKETAYICRRAQRSLDKK